MLRRDTMRFAEAEFRHRGSLPADDQRSVESAASDRDTAQPSPIGGPPADDVLRDLVAALRDLADRPPPPVHVHVNVGAIVLVAALSAVLTTVALALFVPPGRAP